MLNILAMLEIDFNEFNEISDTFLIINSLSNQVAINYVLNGIRISHKIHFIHKIIRNVALISLEFYHFYKISRNIAKWQQSDRDYNLSRIGFIASSKRMSFDLNPPFLANGRAALRSASRNKHLESEYPSPRAFLPPTSRSDYFSLVFAWTCLPYSSRTRTVLELGKFYYCPEGITARQ